MGQKGCVVMLHQPLCANNTHNPTTKTIMVCALQRPTCPQHRAIDRHQAGMQTQQRKHMGVNPTTDKDTPWRGQIQREKREGGYISKEFCAKTDLCPLASPRFALVGVCLLRHPDKGKTG